MFKTLWFGVIIVVTREPPNGVMANLALGRMPTWHITGFVLLHVVSTTPQPED